MQTSFINSSILSGKISQASALEHLTVPSIDTSPGSTLYLTPPFIFDNVSTTTSLGSIALLTIVWSWVIKYAAHTIASCPSCGFDACDAWPFIVINILFDSDIIAFGFTATVPIG